MWSSMCVVNQVHVCVQVCMAPLAYVCMLLGDWVLVCAIGHATSGVCGQTGAPRRNIEELKFCT